MNGQVLNTHVCLISPFFLVDVDKITLAPPLLTPHIWAISLTWFGRLVDVMWCDNIFYKAIVATHGKQKQTVLREGKREWEWLGFYLSIITITITRHLYFRSLFHAHYQTALFSPQSTFNFNIGVLTRVLRMGKSTEWNNIRFLAFLRIIPIE